MRHACCAACTSAITAEQGVHGLGRAAADSLCARRGLSLKIKQQQGEARLGMAKRLHTFVPLSRAYMAASGLKRTASVPGGILVLYWERPLAMFHMRSMSSRAVLNARRPLGCTHRPVTSFLQWQTTHLRSFPWRPFWGGELLLSVTFTGGSKLISKRKLTGQMESTCKIPGNTGN